MKEAKRISHQAIGKRRIKGSRGKGRGKKNKRGCTLEKKKRPRRGRQKKKGEQSTISNSKGKQTPATKWNLQAENGWVPSRVELTEYT